MKKITFLTLTLLIMSTLNMNAQESQKTFAASDKVTVQKVSFKNRYGIKLSGDLYLPKNRDSKPLAALAVSGPFGAVKEQSSGLYAQTMAERGFATLAFDPSFTGESGGDVRSVASPDINTEDFSAAVDYLGIQSFVDKNKIGVIGICGFGGFSLSAAAVDKRIKAVATVSMYDMSRVMAKGWQDKMKAEERSKMLEQMSQQRWVDAKNDTLATGTRNLPETREETTDPFTQEYFDYYRTPRGFHKNSLNSNGAWTATNAFPFMNFPLLTYIQEIAPRPILIIVGDRAYSKYFGEDAYKLAAQPKELYIVKDAGHVDLYDRMDKIPFDKLTSFFQQYLK